MPTTKELKETRFDLGKKIQAFDAKITAEKRQYTPEEKSEWTKINAEFDALTETLTRAEKVESINTELALRGQPIKTETADDKPGADDANVAMRAWALRGTPQAVDDDKASAAAKRCGFDIRAKELRFNLSQKAPRNAAELRALTTQTGASGGFTIPEGFIPALERAMLFFGGMRAVAEVMRTATGNDMPWPTADDTSNTGAIIAENTTVDSQDVTFAQILFHAYKYTSKMVKVPNELLQDSAIDIPSLLGSMLGERLGRIHNTHFTTGDGAAKPKGIITASTAGKTTAAATAITADELLDLYHSVDVAYRPGASWMFHDNILLYIRKLKQATGNYLWSPGIDGPAGDRLWGAPYTINNDMQSSVATATKTVLFGHLSKYKIRDVQEIRLVRLVERFADSDQQAFLAFTRNDGNLLDAGTHPVKHMLQA